MKWVRSNAFIDFDSMVKMTEKWSQLFQILAIVIDSKTAENGATDSINNLLPSNIIREL